MNKIIRYNNADIFYRIEGKGQPVLLIHGFGEDGMIWDKQVQELKENYQLIIPDLPGSGKSSLMNQECTMESMAECIHHIIKFEFGNLYSTEQLKDLLILIGHSMGGYIALAYIEKYHEQVKAFGLFHSTTYADTEAKKEARLKSIRFIQQNGAAKFIEQSIPSLFSEPFKQKNPSIVEELVQRYTNFSAEALVQYYEAMIKRPDRTILLKEFMKPILFIIGEHDTAIPLEHSLQQCHLPDESYIQLLQNSGHYGMLEEPKKASDFLKKFLREIEIVKSKHAL